MSYCDPSHDHFISGNYHVVQADGVGPSAGPIAAVNDDAIWKFVENAACLSRRIRIIRSICHNEQTLSRRHNMVLNCFTITCSRNVVDAGYLCLSITSHVDLGPSYSTAPAVRPPDPVPPPLPCKLFASRQACRNLPHHSFTSPSNSCSSYRKLRGRFPWVLGKEAMTLRVPNGQ